MANRNMGSQSWPSREVFAAQFVGRLTMIGTAALGFLVTFMLLGHQVASLKNVLLPLVSFLPIYLILISLSMLWSANTMARMGVPTWTRGTTATASLRKYQIITPILSLAFGVVAAIIYVHTVTK